MTEDDFSSGCGPENQENQERVEIRKADSHALDAGPRPFPVPPLFVAFSGDCSNRRQDDIGIGSWGAARDKRY